MILATVAGLVGSVLPLLQFILMVLGVPCLWLAIQALKKYLNG